MADTQPPAADAAPTSTAAEAPRMEGPPAAPAGACADCAQGFVWSGAPTGQETVLGDVKAYYAAPTGGAKPDTPVILMIPDAFGWKLVNSRLLCDSLAKATGFHAYLPDVFLGDEVVADKEVAGLLAEPTSFMGKLAQGFKFAVNLPALLSFLKKHGVAATQPVVERIVEELKKKHGEATKIGAVGYCWGGKYALRLGAQGKAAAVVACHPSFVNPAEDDLKDCKVPCLFIRAESDSMFGSKLWNETEAVLKGAGAVVESELYKGTSHGFAVRCKESVAAEKAKDAANNTAAWFSKYLV